MTSEDKGLMVTPFIALWKPRSSAVQDVETGAAETAWALRTLTRMARGRRPSGKSSRPFSAWAGLNRPISVDATV